jgi:tetratricopeptide (TPR) repeat protein
VEHLEKALALDPYHHRANSMLGLLQLFLGRHDEARVQIAAGAKLFPDDPHFKLLKAILCALNDDLKSAHRLLDKAQPQLGAQKATEIRPLLELLNLLCHLEEAEENSLRFQERIARSALIAKGVGGFRPGSNEQDVLSFFRSLSPPPALAKALKQIPHAFLVMSTAEKMGPKQLDALIQELAESAKTHPDGLVQYLRGGLLVLRAEDRDQRWEEAEQAFLAAATTPSLAKIQRTALMSAARIEAFLAHPNWPRTGPEVKKRFADNVRQLLALGPLRPEEASYLAHYTEHSLRDFDLTRHLYAEWERLAPKDPSAARKRAQFELRVGAYPLAIEAANRVLTHRPKDKEATEVHNQAMEKLRAQAKELAP